MSSPLGEAFIPIRAVLDKLDGDLDQARGKVEGALGKIGSTLQNAGVLAISGAMAGIGAAVGAVGLILKSSIPLAADFQSQVVGLGIAASSSGISLDQLHDAALQVGGDTQLVGVSATGAADAMTGLYKAGLTTTEIFGDLQGYMAGTVDLGGALRAAIDLAAATELDMVQASDLASVALATFGGELESETERAEFINAALNNMVQAADASVAEVNDLADALMNIGPTASALGIPIQDVNNALALLSTRGISGAEAGTALKSMLTNLQRPSNEVKDTLRQLGVSLYDAEGAFVGLPSLVEQLSGALTGANQVMRTVGGRTEEQNRLLKQAQDRYQSLTDRINKHSAGLQIMSDKSLANANTELANAAAIIEELNSIQGTAVASTVTLTDEQRNLAVQTLAGTYGMNALNTLIGEGVQGWDAMAEATATAAGIQTQAEAKANTFRGRMEALQGTIETLKIGIGEQFLPIAQRLTEWFAGVVEQYGPQIVAVVEIIGNIFSSFFNNLEEGMGPLNSFIEAIWHVAPQEVLDALVNLRDNILPGLMSWFEESVQPILDTIANFVSWKDVLIGLAIAVGSVVIPIIWSILSPILAVIAVGALLIGAVALLRNAWENNWGGIRDKVAAIWAWLQPIFESLKKWLGENIPRALETLKEFWVNVLLPAMQAVWDWLFTVYVPFFQNVLGPLIMEKIPAAIEVLKNFWLNVLLPAIQNVWNWISTVLVPFFQNVIVPWLQEKIPAAIETLRSFWEETLLPAIEKVWAFIQDNLVPLFVALWKLVEVTGGVALTALQGLWENVLLPAIEGVWAFIQDKLIPILEDLWDKFTTWIEPALERLAPLFDGVGSAISGISGAIQTAIGWIGNLTDSIGNIRLPEWLTPGSPTPFEMGIRGISSALQQLNSISSNMPLFNMQLQPAMAWDGGGQGAGGLGQTNYSATTTIYTDRDPLRVLHAARHLDKLGRT